MWQKQKLIGGKKAMRVAASAIKQFTLTAQKKCVFLSLSLSPSEIYLLALKSQICYKQYFFTTSSHAKTTAISFNQLILCL